MAETGFAQHPAADFLKRAVRSASRSRGRLSTAALVLAVLAPKCPLCGVVYCGVASATGLVVLPELPGVFWSVAVPLAGIVSVQALQALRRERYVGCSASATGVFLVLLGKTWTTAPDGMVYAGLALMLLGAVMSRSG
ncbi:MAG: hypothetical protein RIQ93_2276 [Verrucomicrobiota bacterium]|jgi:hypothetical protein